VADEPDDSAPTGKSMITSISVRIEPTEDPGSEVFLEWENGGWEAPMSIPDAAALIALFRSAQVAYFDHDEEWITFEARREDQKAD
jgi:hypothetical protein